MAILEDQLNGRIATLLGRMAPEWSVRGENRGAFQGSQRQPDILITQTGAQPVVIENEYLPANTVEEEARDRLGERLDASVVQASGRVNAVVALRSPTDLHDCAGLDDVDSLLKQGITLEYALFTGMSDVDSTRFPKSGFIKGQHQGPGGVRRVRLYSRRRSPAGGNDPGGGGAGRGGDSATGC